jgi:hypothetical protein
MILRESSKASEYPVEKPRWQNSQHNNAINKSQELHQIVEHRSHTFPFIVVLTAGKRFAGRVVLHPKIQKITTITRHFIA